MPVQNRKLREKYEITPKPVKATINREPSKTWTADQFPDHAKRHYHRIQKPNNKRS